METCMAATCAASLSPTPTSSIFLQLLHTIMVSQCALGNSLDYPPDRTDEIQSSQKSFDFIIAGGGSAGSVLAHRLTENPNWDVLLIEAGDTPAGITDVPSMVLYLAGGMQDYAYRTEPNDAYCQGIKNKQCRWSKGRALGGSSVINAMLYILGNDRDYNRWAEMGNPGWSYDEVLPYFLKSLNCPSDHIQKWGNKHCNTGGPMNIGPYNYTSNNIQDMILQAASELGLDTLEPLNGDRFVGYGKAYGTLHNGRRMNMAKAFLSPIKDRKNLHLMKSTRVDKILLDGKKAIGVTVTLKDGQTMDLKATKEVILSAGSIATPQILMLSGIGPKKHLDEMGIDTVLNLPVGENLQDHPIWVGLQGHFVDENIVPPPPTAMLDEMYNFLIHGRGALASVGGINILGFVNFTDMNAKYPEVEFHHSLVPRFNIFQSRDVLAAVDVADELLDLTNNDGLTKDIVFFCPVLLNPKSRGVLKLRSQDPADQIKIYANYFDVQEDMDIMLKSVDFVKSLINTKPFKDKGMTLHHFDIPACRNYQPDSREYWKCNLRHLTTTIFHPVGTAKMGPYGDSTAVVDPWLKVHGAKRLRVIDASIMPLIVSANTNAATMMIAERGADMIKREWAVNDEL